MAHSPSTNDEEAWKSYERRVSVAFWIMGMLNNSSFVIMIAAAKQIEQGGVGIVYLADIMPGVLMKSTAPYWFDHVSYGARSIACVVLMALSFIIVATSSNLSLQLLGVALASSQSSMGEASMLALASRYRTRPSTSEPQQAPGAAALTAWSSGTGFAGVFGYAWLNVLHVWIGLSFAVTILSALVLTIVWLYTFFRLLPPPVMDESMGAEQGSDKGGPWSPLGGQEGIEEGTPVHSPLVGSMGNPEDEQQRLKSDVLVDEGDRDDPQPVGVEMKTADRFRFVAALWPYTIPIFVIYIAEYAMQSGVWSSIGFPASSESAREEFYGYSNWCYQIGVFVSRSSGQLFSPSLQALWCLPLLQLMLLAFFWVDAATKFFYNSGLYFLCVIAGLAGGAVYVHGFKLISASYPTETRELAMAAASLAVDLGILFGSLGGLYVQACIYKVQGIQGAQVDGGFCG